MEQRRRKHDIQSRFLSWEHGSKIHVSVYGDKLVVQRTEPWEPMWQWLYEFTCSACTQCNVQLASWTAVLYYESFKFVHTKQRSPSRWYESYYESGAGLLLNQVNNKIATPKISREQCELLIYCSTELKMIKRYCYCWIPGKSPSGYITVHLWSLLANVVRSAISATAELLVITEIIIVIIK